jgi:hypothetical protein
MPRRLPGIPLLLAIAAATAYAQTTTTTGTPTTSTTSPGSGCRLGHSALCGIGPRLEAFRETVFETYVNDGASLGRLFDPISFRLQKSAFCLTRATMLCVGSEPTPPGKAPRIVPDVNRARAKLRQCVRPLDVVLAKLRSRYARRRIPPAVAAMLASETGGIASDLEAARESLTCPPGSAVGRTD